MNEQSVQRERQTAEKDGRKEEPGAQRINLEAEEKKKARISLLGPVCGIYALFYTLCLFRNADGITYPFFAAGTLCCFFYCLKKCGVPWKKGNGFYAAAIVLMGLSVCMTDDWKLQGLSKTGNLCLVLMLALRSFYPVEQWNFRKYSASLLRSITVIYVIFCGIQILCLFMGNARLPEGLTYTAYSARQGFFQLLFVSMINLAIVIVCLSCFEESRILKGILTAISLMTYILIASSAYRMLLYIGNYYLTFLRVFVLWALLVIAALFAGVIISAFRRRFPMHRYTAVILVSLYLPLAFSRPDYWIADYNLGHAKNIAEMDNPVTDGDAGYTDFWYLASLSADAAPALSKEKYSSIIMSEPAYGAFSRYYDDILEEGGKMGIRDFHFSRRQAYVSVLKALEN